MAVHRSNENLASALSSQETFCIICQGSLRQDQLIATTPCQHRFHNTCVCEHLKSEKSCPVCKAECGPNSLRYENNTLAAELNISAGSLPSNVQANEPFETAPSDPTVSHRKGKYNSRGRGKGAIPKRGMQTRYQASLDRNLYGSRQSVSSNGNRSPGHAATEDLTSYIHSVIQSQEKTMMENLSSFIKSSIEQTLQTQFANLNLTTNTATVNRGPSESRSNVRQEVDNGSNMRSSDSPLESPRSNRTTETVAPAKAAGILLSWRLKFDGSREAMHVEEFLYRIRALTAQTLGNDDQLLCDNLHLLFAGKACDWFWDFHRRNHQYSWQSFCTAFRQRFDDQKDDFDLWEMIRKRQQRENEPFEDFQTAIEKLVARLSHGISELKMIDILKRNAKSALRYELLHLKIQNRSELREEVKKHEHFCREAGNFLPRSRVTRPNVSEIQSEDEEFEEESISKLRRNRVVCWNCDKTGHRFKDCVAERLIFCYGCGAKNTFKPKCEKCNPSENRKQDAQTSTSLSHPTTKTD